MDGKKNIARVNIYSALDFLKSNTKEESVVEALEKALENVRPKVEVRSRRVGGSNYQVPTPVGDERQNSLAMRWIIDAARSARGSRTFGKSLGSELLNAYKGEGNAVRKKEDIKKMADANRAFAQFA